VFDETNGSQVEQVDLDELDYEEAPCIVLRNMSIGDVCPKKSEEPPQAQDQPSSSNQASPPTQDEDQTQGNGDEDQEDEPPQEEDNDPGGDEDNEDKEYEQEIQGQRSPHPRVHQAIQRDYPVNSIISDIHKGVTTRSRVAHFCEHYSFVSSIEPYSACPLAHHCPVRPSTAAIPNGHLVVEGYKYPQQPPLQASKHSEHCIQYKSNRLHSKTQSKRSIHSKSPIQL
jgi:hypothetical protein